MISKPLKTWMIKKKDQKKIIGPIHEEELIQKLISGFLNEKDEICHTNSSWFFIAQTEILNKKIPALLEAKKNIASELTQTLIIHKKKKDISFFEGTKILKLSTAFLVLLALYLIGKIVTVLLK